MSTPVGGPGLGDFVAEQFCDEVYDYVDDSLAEALDDMERELLEAAHRAGANGAADQNSSSIEKTVKTCCDNVQKRLQKEFDRNLDIFDRYVKKNVSAATAAVVGSADSGGGKGGAATGTNPRVRARKAVTGRAAGLGGSNAGDNVDSSAKERGAGDAWVLEVKEGTQPKRLEEEEALDADIHRLRKRRREGLRRCAAMVRKGAREAAVLQDVNDYVEALQMGVSSSFDNNGLTPVPAKIQEAVQSCAELRVTADRAQELTRRLERRVQANAATGAGGGGSSSNSSSGAVVAAPAPRDLQAMFQRSSEQQVVAGGATEYSALEARLKG